MTFCQDSVAHREGVCLGCETSWDQTPVKGQPIPHFKLRKNKDKGPKMDPWGTPNLFLLKIVKC